MKNTVIKFVDANADGCGTDIVIYVEVTGEKAVGENVIKKISTAISNYQKRYDDWDTDSIIDVAFKKLKAEGYKCKTLNPSFEIEF